MTCFHDWRWRGIPGDEWEGCWLCGAVKPDPLPDDLAHREVEPMGSE